MYNKNGQGVKGGLKGCFFLVCAKHTHTLPAAKRASLSNFRIALASVSKFSQSVLLQQGQVSSNNKELDVDAVSGMERVNQSCNDSSIEGRNEVESTLFASTVVSNEGKVFALLLTRLRGLLKDMTFKIEFGEKREKKRKKGWE
jgi:hypothetical protein